MSAPARADRRTSSRAVTRGGTLALLDQAAVSGSRFLTTLLVGRIAGAEELGVYALAFMALIVCSLAQEALLTTPFTVYAPRLEPLERARYAGGILLQYAGFAVLSALALAALATGLRLHPATLSLAPVAWVLAAVAPLWLLRELARGVAFARMRLGRAFALDAGVALIQLAGLGWLAWRDSLSAPSAYAWIGISCALGGAGWLAVAWRDFAFHLPSAMAAWQRNWKFGRWVLAGEAVGITHGYAVHWALALTLGVAATGVFSAAQSIVLLANPLILGMTTFLEPRTARAYALGGVAELLRVVRGTLLLFAVALSGFCLLLLVVGDALLSALYGQSYAGNGAVITLLAVAAMGSALSGTLSSGLKAIERPDVNSKLRLVGLVVTLLAVAALIGDGGVVGASTGLVCGTLTALVLKWFVFVRLVGDPLRAASEDRPPSDRLLEGVEP